MINEQDLRNLCLNVSRKLIEVPNERDKLNKNSNLQSRIIYPKYERGEGIKKDNISYRISEQEARFLFAQEIQNYHKQFYYSVETPTKMNYLFSDKDNLRVFKAGFEEGQSAMIDMTLYGLKEDDIFNSLVNIEFKAHNVEESHIMKDILKLMAEPQSGLFFHTLKAIDTGTLPDFGNDKKSGIFNKYIQSFKEYNDEWNKGEKEQAKFITFAICIIKQKILLLKTILRSDKDKPEDFFHIEYSVTRDKMEIKRQNGWELIDLRQ